MKKTMFDFLIVKVQFLAIIHTSQTSSQPLTQKSNSLGDGYDDRQLV